MAATDNKSQTALTTLSPLASVYRPSSAVVDPTAPKLVLLQSWMDARDNHIAKYIATYQELYPTASILLIKSTVAAVLNSKKARHDIVPAAHVLHEVLGEDTKRSGNGRPEMLVHVFSNGGSCMLYHLYDVYETTASAARSVASQDIDNVQLDGKHFLPPHVTVFDSAPGRWTYHSGVRALILSVPAGWMRYLAYPFIYMLQAAWWVKYRICYGTEPMHIWGLAHNDRAKAQETCRAYAYSETDDMIEFRGVEEHIDDAEAKGFRVLRREKFKDSLHVAHVRSDPEKYWRLVRETWENR